MKNLFRNFKKIWKKFLKFFFKKLKNKNKRGDPFHFSGARLKWAEICMKSINMHGMPKYAKICKICIHISISTLRRVPKIIVFVHNSVNYIREQNMHLHINPGPNDDDNLEWGKIKADLKKYDAQIFIY